MKIANHGVNKLDKGNEETVLFKNAHQYLP